ncbi:GNAT family N-acetyltransferase [Pseudomonas sp. CBSPBW29]|uniref:GNAT family N-acetyltransferase n=1 Tax=Pseudomonas sp. CBS TaxID=2971912 RepID=UPI0021AB9BEF|nr:GNAT family N-acetyltransferase [Pseudomonas sp. CBS]WEL45671.1 GNAT family N-acetyltransferase [Pseudomonas sp. CBSPBW29]WEL67940.1 GNAT family N-acetyltransferase [Pseudomonas sp. CBSPGW29]WEL73803.1 GNAT family N-acetyltransferase [Pseudomonas sp. CBSPCGW29]WEL79674.1 GNAT family N-acetyltransferase [Pseudomonas sp. CBSPAW29]WEL85575.1 GNAT family N-acetyltransferase [Pseudomonas sp. CBSPCAW29]WEL91269.1 GNAT family N-acetyltransferase [Pseudomonas sp. CBSPCBW29]
MDLRIEINETPQEVDYQAILTPLREYNQAQTGLTGTEKLAILIKDDAGTTQGGLYAKISGQWLFVELLVVPEFARGQGLGSKLMNKAESLAREKGFQGIWLDTFSFQAPDFYLRLGFSIFGELKDYPIVGYNRFFMEKRFDLQSHNASNTQL